MVRVAPFGCGRAEPRRQLYFEAHIDEAREIVEGCRDGSVRGDECTNAERALSRNEAKERSKRFLGDGKAYTPR
ncbi:MAG: hypothetical protein K0M74_16040 [Sphingopyxis sp.]|nr:hypothetical protein [Sphingopyxis sp.]